MLTDVEVCRFSLCHTSSRQIPTCPVTDDYGADKTAVSRMENENHGFNALFMGIHLHSNN
jgi:hypothetical protein